MNKKKIVRAKFRTVVFKRDNFTCRICNCAGLSPNELDAHHITSRDDMPNGGYVLENGITLCPECHLRAEMTCNGDQTIFPKYAPIILYSIIQSSWKQAVEASKRLGKNE